MLSKRSVTAGLQDQPVNQKDKRMLVLLALGVFIFSSCLFSFPSGLISCVQEPGVYLVHGSPANQTLLRVKDSDEISIYLNKGYSLISQLRNCGDLAAELSLLLGARLPINRADRQALIMLPGIGPRRAEKILSARKSSVFIHDMNQLKHVAGLSYKSAEAISRSICFD